MSFWYKKITATALWACCCLIVFAQKKGSDSSLLKLVNGISLATGKYTPEKIYVQTDRPSYSTGDTLWFKIYLFDAAFLHASPKSGIAYLEIAGSDNQVVRRIMVALKDGLGRGYFALDEELYPAGAYTLSAYTNWMRNFGQAVIFRKPFLINHYSGDDWLISARFRPASENEDQVETSLVFERQDKKPLSFRNLQIALTDGKKTWYKNTFRTDVNGGLDFNFKIPSNADKEKLSLLVENAGTDVSEPEKVIPLVLNRKSKIDLQFMPEGGNLIAGIKNRVAFKAVGEDGMGRDVSGLIFDSKRQVIDRFRSTHLGMGHVDFIPRKNEKYTAEITGRGQKLYPLPEVESEGYLLQVINPFDQDSVAVHIFSGRGNMAAGEPLYLVARARGIGCFGAKIALQSGEKTFHISKSLFPTGITRFTIYNKALQPVNQRMIFIDHHDLLSPDISEKNEYGTRDKVELNIRVLDKNGRPLQGSFSLAVTDDHKVYVDTLKRNSLVSDILLTSDLKGHVEDPGYYFSREMTAKMANDLDDLLLTQGWVTFSRDTSSVPLYAAEQAFSIEGKVMNIFNKPVKGSKVLLFSRKPFFLDQTTTDSRGIFNFSPLYPLDTASFMLQARNKRGKSFNVGITVNAFKPPELPPLDLRIIPWYVNVNTIEEKIVHTQVADNERMNRLLGKHVLKEVVVVGQKAIPGSKNLNGPGGSDFVLDESDMIKAGKTTLRDLLRQKIKGFHLGGKHLDMYVLHTEMVHLIIDGVNLDFFQPDGESGRVYYDRYLDYLTAEDIKGIEVMASPKYTGAYFQKFLNPMAKPFEHVFIEVTTYSGNGAFMKNTPGVFLYRPPVAFSTPARFYSPKYTVGEDRSLPDIRSTIYWEPDVVTDENGEAKLSFYTADKPGTYTLILEGADMKGNIGSAVKKVTVK